MGRLLNTALPNATTTVYGYDNLNRVLSIINSLNAGGVENSKAVYTYNNRNQRTSKQTLTGTTAYDYDSIGRLTGITLPDTNDVTYLYSKTDSRVQKKGADDVLTTYKSNNLNRYTKAGMKDITYDANGNVTSDGVNTYTYDALNRLIQGISSTKTVNYIYDPSGKLYSREVLNNSDQSQVSYKWFIYSGDDVIMTKDASGTVVERYILGGGVDNQLAVAIGSDRYYFNRDGLGSVVSITDSTGAVVETYEYTTFGLPTIKNASGVIISESTIGNTLMFTGRMWDAELGIYDYRNRVYNPAMGVFYQTDPLGYADSTNMYAYCVNDPVNFVDPFGENLAILELVPGTTSASGSSRNVGFSSVTKDLNENIDWNAIGNGAVSGEKKKKCAQAIADAIKAGYFVEEGKKEEKKKQGKKPKRGDRKKVPIDKNKPIDKQLEGTGQRKNLNKNPNLKGINIDETLKNTPNQLEKLKNSGELSKKAYRQIMKAFEGRDLGKRY